MVVWPNLVNWLIMFCNGCLMEFIVYSLVLHPQKHCSSIVRVKNTLNARKLVRSFQRRVAFDLVKIKNSYAWLLKFCLANVTEKCKFQRHSKELEILSKQRIFFHPVVYPVYQDTESFQWHSHGLGASESSPDLNELLSTHCHKRKTSLRTVFLRGVFFLTSTLLSNFLIWNRFLVLHLHQNHSIFQILKSN